MNTAQSISNSIFSLPREVFRLILKRVPGEDLAKTGRVSKAWLASLHTYEVHKHITLGLRTKWMRDFTAKASLSSCSFILEKKQIEIPFFEIYNAHKNFTAHKIEDNFYIAPDQEKPSSLIHVTEILGTGRHFNLPVSSDKILGCWQSSYLLYETNGLEYKKVINIVFKTGRLLRSYTFDKYDRCILKGDFLVFTTDNKTRIFSLEEDRFVTDYLSIQGQVAGCSLKRGFFISFFCDGSIEPSVFYGYDLQGKQIWSYGLIQILRYDDLKHCQITDNECFFHFNLRYGIGIRNFIPDGKYTSFANYFKSDNSCPIENGFVREYRESLYFNFRGWCDSKFELSLWGNHEDEENFCKAFFNNEGKLQFYAYKRCFRDVENYVCTLTET